MQRRSEDLAAVISYALMDSLCRLPALHILTTVIHGLMDADGPPHPLLKHIYTDGRIDFPAILEEGNLTENQRQIVAAAYDLFGYAVHEEVPVRLWRICQGPDVNNFEAVIDGMRVHAGKDPGGLARSRIVSRLRGFLEEWTRAEL